MEKIRVCYTVETRVYKEIEITEEFSQRLHNDDNWQESIKAFLEAEEKIRKEVEIDSDTTLQAESFEIGGFCY